MVRDDRPVTPAYVHDDGRGHRRRRRRVLRREVRRDGAHGRPSTATVSSCAAAPTAARRARSAASIIGERSIGSAACAASRRSPATARTRGSTHESRCWSAPRRRPAPAPPDALPDRVEELQARVNELEKRLRAAAAGGMPRRRIWRAMRRSRRWLTLVSHAARVRLDGRAQGVSPGTSAARSAPASSPSRSTPTCRSSSSPSATTSWRVAFARRARAGRGAPASAARAAADQRWHRAGARPARRRRQPSWRHRRRRSPPRGQRLTPRWPSGARLPAPHRRSRRGTPRCTVAGHRHGVRQGARLRVDDDGSGVVRGVGRQTPGPRPHAVGHRDRHRRRRRELPLSRSRRQRRWPAIHPTQVDHRHRGRACEGLHHQPQPGAQRPDQPITEAELQKLIEGVQREALQEAERSITWETGLPSVDVRLVHAAVTGASIDGYPVTNPVGFQGRHVRISDLQRLRAAHPPRCPAERRARLDRELLAVVAEPYAVARCMSGDAVQRRARCSSMSVAAPRMWRSCARVASRARACSRSAVAPSPSRSPIGWSCRSQRAEAVKVAFATSADGRACRRGRAHHRRGRRRLVGGCGAGARGVRQARPAAGPHRAVWWRVAAAAAGGRAARPGFRAAPALQSTAQVAIIAPSEVTSHPGRDRAARRPAGRHPDGAGVSGHRDGRDRTPLDAALRRVLRGMRV